MKQLLAQAHTVLAAATMMIPAAARRQVAMVRVATTALAAADAQAMMILAAATQALAGRLAAMTLVPLTKTRHMEVDAVITTTSYSPRLLQEK
jgi:hypothetical protein